jgi:YD repeat-containing protein
VPKTKYTYDVYGNELSQTDANSNLTSFTYDAFGDQLTRSLPDGESESETYDNFGRLASSLDFNQNQTAYSYDSLGRVYQVTYTSPTGTSPDETVTYHYNALGQKDWMTDATASGTATTNYYYDAQGNLTSTVTPQGTVNHVYDPATGLLMRTYTADGAVDRRELRL